MLEIDGSFGEGGGQILRTSLSLSCVLKRPFRIFDIRKKRKKPGLMPQHLACVRALASLTNADVRGDFPGSGELVFRPGETHPGRYYFDIGTAGSTSLLLQAILPPLIFSEGRSDIILKGGTHVPFSPPFNYVSEVFLPSLRNIGIHVSTSAEAFGFYPKGGGTVTSIVFPDSALRELHLSEREELSKITGISAVVNLPLSIAERQRTAAIEHLSAHGLSAEIELFQCGKSGQGTFLFLKTESESCLAGFSSIGERGKRAEAVGREAADELIAYYRSGAAMDHHLADQLILYLALAKEASSFTASRISDHLLTNLWVTEKFTGTRHSVEGNKDAPGRIIIYPGHFA